MVPFGVPLNSRCRTVLGTQKGTIILTTTHMYVCRQVCMYTCLSIQSTRPIGFRALDFKAWRLNVSLSVSSLWCMVFEPLGFRELGGFRVSGFWALQGPSKASKAHSCRAHLFPNVGALIIRIGFP